MKTPDEKLESALLNTLSSATVLSRELSRKIETKDKIRIFEEKRQFLAQNGIQKLKAEDIAPPLAELLEILKDFLVLYEPKHRAKAIELSQKSFKDSIVESKTRKAEKTIAETERELKKKRKKLSPHLKLLQTVTETLGIPARDLYKKTDKELKLMLAEFMMK